MELFQCTELGGYSDLHLKIDILLLCDIFENFDSLCLETYKLDFVYYFTILGFAFDAMHKCTKIKLELLMDYDKYLIIEHSIRGGIWVCMNKNILL